MCLTVDSLGRLCLTCDTCLSQMKSTFVVQLMHIIYNVAFILLSTILCGTRFLCWTFHKTAEQRHQVRRQVRHAVPLSHIRGRSWSHGFLSRFSGCRDSDNARPYRGQLRVSKKWSHYFCHSLGLTFQLNVFFVLQFEFVKNAVMRTLNITR